MYLNWPRGISFITRIKSFVPSMGRIPLKYHKRALLSPATRTELDESGSSSQSSTSPGGSRKCQGCNLSLSSCLRAQSERHQLEERSGNDSHADGQVGSSSGRSLSSGGNERRPFRRARKSIGTILLQRGVFPRSQSRQQGYSAQTARSCGSSSAW